MVIGAEYSIPLPGYSISLHRHGRNLRHATSNRLNRYLKVGELGLDRFCGLDRLLRPQP